MNLDQMLEQAQAHERDFVKKCMALDLNEKIGYLADNEVEVKGLDIYRQHRNWGKDLFVVELSRSGDKVYEGNGRGIERCILGYWVNLVLDAYQKHKDIEALKNHIEQAQATVDKIKELHTNYQDTGDDDHYLPPEPRNLLKEILDASQSLVSSWYPSYIETHETLMREKMIALHQLLQLVEETP